MLEFLTEVPNVWEILSLLNTTAPLWLPLLLGFLAWELWLDFRRREWISNIKWSLIEIRLPQEIARAPLAMEIVFGALHEGSRGTWLEQYYQGRVMLWSSLEIVSTEGSVRFYMRLPLDVKNNVEAKIYSQFPGVELHEVSDYTRDIDYNDDTWKLFATTFELTKPDPYPIMTYVDYGLGKLDVEAENQIDPIAPLIEFLGIMERGEHAWFQILIQPTRKRFKKKGSFFQKQDWRAEADELVKKLRGETDSFQSLDVGTQNTIKAVQNSVGKFGFDCGMRAVYLAKKEKFNGYNIGALIGATKQFSAEGLNGFKPKDKTKFDFPWEDYKDMRVESMRKQMLDAYRRRSYFYPPYRSKPFVLNTEELATIYHFPARVTNTPGFRRIESQKSEPPANLPL